MPIEHLLTRASRKVVATTEEINTEVLAILASLGSTHRDYVHASEMYNSDFFREESPEFKLALCTALADNFKSFPNSYWANAIRQPSGSAQENI